MSFQSQNLPWITNNFLSAEVCKPKLSVTVTSDDDHVKDEVQFCFWTLTFTMLGSSCRFSVYLGSWSLCVTQGCLRTWPAVSLRWGSTWSIFETRSWRVRAQSQGYTKVWASFLKLKRLFPHLGLSGDRVPVSAAERELPAADPSQDLLRSVLGAVSEGREPADAERESGFRFKPGPRRDSRLEICVFISSHPVSIV